MNQTPVDESNANKTTPTPTETVESTEVVIAANQFSTRKDLEKYISAKYNLDTSSKDAVITGTRQELKKLQLSHGSLYWGIKCREEAYVQEKTKVNTHDRGQKTPFGIDGNFQESKKIKNKDNKK